MASRASEQQNLEIIGSKGLKIDAKNVMIKH
jgi:hypothetical protein